MRRQIRFTLAVGLLVLISFVGMQCATTGYHRTSVGVQVGYSSGHADYLAAYGQWIAVEPYGMVWVPYVSYGWQPFYHGYWVWTGYEWAWVSYEPYGWLVYHYGYWDYQPGIGWFWIYGTDWSPARVEWVIYGSYIGWTPLPPRGVSRPRPWQTNEIHIWNVVEVKNFTRENVGEYRVNRFPKKEKRGEQFISDRAPDLQLIEKQTRRQIPVVKIDRQPVKMQKEEFQKVVLPPSEEKKVEKYRSQIERKVLKPQKSGKEQDKASEKKKSGKKKNSKGD